MVGWSHDGAQAALGFEKQGRVGWAILSVSGRVSDHVGTSCPSIRSARRVAAGLRRKGLFLSERSNLYAAQGPIVKCDERTG
jgi:hypothetical protein